MREFIDRNELRYEDIECTDGRTYMVVHASEIDNADVITEQEIVKPYLHKLAVQILEKYSGLDICEHLDEYDWDENDISYYKQVGDIGDIMDMIDNLLSEQEKKR